VECIIFIKKQVMFSFTKKITEPENAPEIGDFNPGDIDPTTGRMIIYIVYQKRGEFIVTIDKDTNLNWYADETLTYAEDIGEILSQVSLATALVDRIFLHKRDRIAYKKMLGDILGRVLDDGNTKAAKPMMDETISRVMEHAREKVRMVYIYAAVKSVMVVGLLVMLLVLNRKQLLGILNQPDILKIILCTLLGGVGAFITTFARFETYKGSIIAGLPIHRLDGFLRIFYGLIAGLIITLAVKGNVLAGFAGDQHWILYFLAMVAGASEVLVPNLIHQTESRVQLKNPPEPDPKNGKKPDPATPEQADPTTPEPDGKDKPESLPGTDPAAG
jgi:hypothetical protein